VTPVVAIVAALSVAATRPPLALTVLQERVRLPVDAVRVSSSPFERSVVVELPRSASPAAVALRLKFSSRICPDVDPGASSIVFRCTTPNVRASLSHAGGVGIVDLAQTSVPPWRPAEEGPPLAVLDPAALGLEPCPGTSQESLGECALAAGDAAGAHRHFEAAAKAGPSPLAEMRLGDLALAADDPDAAVAHWVKARNDSRLERLISIRFCELEPHCLGGESEATLYDAKAAGPGLRNEVILRRLRLRALRGDVVGAAGEAVLESRGDGACATSPRFCRHLLEVALRLPPPEGTEALGVYLETPHRLEGAEALPLARAAAAQSRAAGAPLWAANLLASLTGRVTPAEQGAHLLLVAQLYVEGGDRIRADEILRFARTRLTKAEMASPGWTGVAQALKRPGRAARAAPAVVTTSVDTDLAAARAALDSARLAALRKGAAR